MRKTLQRIAFFVAAVSAVPAFAQAPPIIPLQGFLTDAEGAPRDGEFVVDIELFDASMDGASLHSESLMVDVDAGFFSAELGTGDLLDLELFRDNAEVWVQVTVDSDVLSPRIQFGSVPYAAYANWAGNADTLEGFSAAELQETAWDDITGIPADLLDGDDVGATTWDELAGIPSYLYDLADTSGFQNRVIGSCGAGEAITTVNVDGTVVCTPVGEIYAAGAGLGLSGGVFSVDSSVVQNRVSGTCPSGQAVAAVNETGGVVCVPIGSTAVTYDAGFGLELTSGAFSVDSSVVQTRVSGVCPSGEFMTGVNEDGSVDCAEPGPFNEASLDLQGVGVYANTDPQLVWARYLHSKSVPFEGARVMVTANGIEGGGMDSVGGGAGLLTVELGFCKDTDGNSMFTMPIDGSVALPTVYMTDLLPFHNAGPPEGGGDDRKACFIRVFVQATNPASPVIVRDISLIPDFDAVAVVPAP